MFGDRKQFNPFSLFVGILSIILALVIVKNPLSSTFSLIYMIAILLIIDGFSRWSDIKAIRTYNKTWLYVGAGYDIFLGVVMFFAPWVGVVLIWFLLAVSVIFNSGLEIWLNQRAFSDHNGGYWFNLVLGVLGVIAGIIILFNPYLALSITLFTISFFLMFYGVIKIIRSV
ncbi:HdeD family acid-resistance protein [Lactobacillus sp. Sy-1]|uniref:HdeD family acid-resistance protein n=1 Tax=Lactobacillus sp. Sy-1 TaxID=2109645 RepID=UPI001C5BE87F|nr:DUF308 domain-containing protein [Lactobacillus sp. Sy-1]MBW1605916.1 DUF308 domain-containing protein [Lactobacillus sp. Sy-1]